MVHEARVISSGMKKEEVGKLSSYCPIIILETTVGQSTMEKLLKYLSTYKAPISIYISLEHKQKLIYITKLKATNQ